MLLEGQEWTLQILQPILEYISKKNPTKLNRKSKQKQIKSKTVFSMYY